MKTLARNLPKLSNLLLILLSFLMGACRADRPNELQIGAVLPLTGGSAAWGEQGRWGIEFAVSEVNATGGVSGKPVHVVYEDSQAAPRLGLTAIQKLISANHVPAVIGDIVSASTLAMAPIAEENRVVLIAPTSSAPAITQAGRYIFRVWPSDHLEGQAAADWAIRIGIKKAAVLHIANDYGQGLAEVFAAQFEKAGGATTTVQSYSQDETDFRPYLTRVKSDGAELLYLISYYKDAALILRQAKELSLGIRFLGATAVESPELLSLAGKAAEGLVYPTIVDFDPTAPVASQVTFIENFRKKFGKSPDWASSHSHDAAMIILEALKSGAQTGEDIRAYIDKRRSFEGVTGKIHFDKNGDVVDKPVMMKTVHQGKFVKLES